MYMTEYGRWWNVLLKAADDEYMLTTEALDVGTFITTGIKCPRRALRLKIFDNCIGGKQAIEQLCTLCNNVFDPISGAGFKSAHFICSFLPCL
ncbi:hypothetical protein Btru_049385 [Bulinus truncatus]|nr:hypothetical protein Btru_049385 [Bulinus truncatus]